MKRYTVSPVPIGPMIESEHGEYVLYNDAIKNTNKKVLEITDILKETEEKLREMTENYYSLKSKYIELKKNVCEGNGCCPNYRPSDSDSDVDF